ncbi:MAG: MBL fold metallo-hydrolase [Chitinophagia bacterium]|nr:MBL fold metallo-hydrolase [Chitinophagia bacterium]
MTTIFPLSEGVFTVGHDKEFIPFDVATESLNSRSKGSLLVEIQPFLVVTPSDKIVLDTGLGYTLPDGQLQIHANIAKAGFQPTDITKVLLSHLHKDHAGALTYTNAQGNIAPTFAHAQYCIYEPEYRFAIAQGQPSFLPATLAAIAYLPNVMWLTEPLGIIGNGISYRHSGGHSPHHIVFSIQKGDSIIFYGGDEAPQLRQMKFNYMAKYDYDGKRAMQLRQEYAEQGREAGWQFLFYHDVGNPVAQLS